MSQEAENQPIHDKSPAADTTLDIQQTIKTEDADTTPLPTAPSPQRNAFPENPFVSAPPSSIQETIEDVPAIEAQALKTIEAIKNEHGLRGGRASQLGSTEPATSDVDTAAEKPTVPAKMKAANKKGVAKKPPSKKRKKEDAVTKDTKVSSKTKQKAKASNVPSLGTPVPAGSEDEDEGSGSGSDSGSDQVYCICRKRDDHSWMIACDGGCDDWFHGKCVSMKESEGPLIDKYICPNCTAAGHGVTTWKPMCRHPDCRKPARLSKANISKYCSDDCGVRFMQIMTRRAAIASGEVKPGGRTRKKPAATTVRNTANGLPSSDEDEPSLLGGPLNLASIKRLITGVQDVNEFRLLGIAVSRTSSSILPLKGANGTTTNDLNADTFSSLSTTDKARLKSITENKDKLRNRMTFLKDREKFIAEAKEQALRYAERESIKVKDFCGFDHRLSWSERDFKAYRDRVNGVESSSSAGETAAQRVTGGTTAASDTDAHAAIKDGLGSANGDAVHEDGYENMCTKKRCDKHKQWQKVMLQDVRFDEGELADSMRDLDREEQEIRERGSLAWAKESVESGGMGNSVEIVGM